ncbi:hypothetical protein B5X24_HaOG202067 [Helicoverpa armigera]|uniref:Uncharacterized protein n=1 Tax=Helicoverpa armigera TaxID=29058 RepID=A0A2W1BVY8_HELAM|nr:hypothetical protein B5X24_HaOG202067 [Helicoverpa armigera]
MRRVSVFGKLKFDFNMTFAVMDSDFGACELRDSIVVHAVGARARVFFLKLTHNGPRRRPPGMRPPPHRALSAPNAPRVA